MNSLHLFAYGRKDFRMHPRALLNLPTGILFQSSFIKEHTLQHFRKELKKSLILIKKSKETQHLKVMQEIILWLRLFPKNSLETQCLVLFCCWIFVAFWFFYLVSVFYRLVGWLFWGFWFVFLSTFSCFIMDVNSLNSVNFLQVLWLTCIFLCLQY